MPSLVVALIHVITISLQIPFNGCHSLYGTGLALIKYVLKKM